MLFSNHAATYAKYMGGLATEAISQYFPTYTDEGSHDAKRMVRFLLNWACQLSEFECLSAAKENFEKVSSGAITWADIDVNFRDFSRNYAIRNGDPDDIQFGFSSIV